MLQTKNDKKKPVQKQKSDRNIKNLDDLSGIKKKSVSDISLDSSIFGEKKAEDLKHKKYKLATALLVNNALLNGDLNILNQVFKVLNTDAY